jgi:hypothetical protein
MSKIVDITHFKEGKRKLVAVPVNGVKTKAVLYLDDWNDLLSIGVSPVWSFYRNQVVVRSRGKVREVAIVRLLRDARAYQKVLPKDENPFNLRRDNLVLSPGSSRYRARDMISIPKYIKEVRNVYE